MGRKYTDNAKTVLSGAISAVATTLTVAAGKGDLFPQVTGKGPPGATPNSFVIKLKNAAGVIEKMRVEHRAAGSDVMGSVGFPLIRGYDGTVAQAWSVGDFVSLTIERSAAQGWEDGFNANALGRAFGYKDSSTVGLVFGYYGGLIYNGVVLTTIADGAVALTASQTNFVERTVAGVVSANTSAFTVGRVPLYTVVTDGTGITSITEKRSTVMQNVGGGLTVPSIDSGTGSLVLKGAGTIAATFAGADTTLAGNLVVSGVGASAIGGSPVASTSLAILGTGPVVHNPTGVLFGLSLQTNGASTSSSFIADFAGNTITLPAASFTLDETGGLRIAPPVYSIGSGAVVNNATTLEIVGAPASGTTKRALWVKAGLVSFDGGQIQFPATQLASSDAHTLDDYEEGTFTAGINFNFSSTGITYSTQTGQYTKVGRFLHTVFIITLTSKGAQAGSVFLMGWPFGAAAADIGYFNFLNMATNWVAIGAPPNGGMLGNTGASTNNNVSVANTDVTNTSSWSGTICYDT